MNAHTPDYMQPIDVHQALAHAHAERAMIVAQLFASLVALPKRLAAAVRPHHRPRYHKGACA